jgi:hypothetical protein
MDCGDCRWLINCHAEDGYPLGHVSADTKKGVVEKALRLMPWMRRRTLRTEYAYRVNLEQPEKGVSA